MTITKVNLFEFVPSTSLGKKYREGISPKEVGFNFALVILDITCATAESLSFKKFKFFDALMQDSACQLTAYNVFKLISDPETWMGITEIKTEAGNMLRNILSQKRQVTQKFVLEIDNPNFAQLVKYALLSEAKNVEGIETTIESLNLRLSKMKVKTLGKNKGEGLIKFIQQDERSVSLRNIKRLADKVFERVFSDEEISNLFMASATDKFNETLRPTLSTKAILMDFVGVLMIKNKLFFDGVDLNKEELSFFVDMPSCKVLQAAEIREKGKDKPILVMECYINDKEALLSRINEEQFVPFILSCAAEDELNESKLQCTERHRQGLERIIKSANVNPPSSIMRIDHFFCNSVEEALTPARKAAAV